MSVDKKSDDGEGGYQRPFRELDVWCESGREGYCGYRSRAGVRTMFFSRRTRLTPDIALLSESSGWNRVISAPLTFVSEVFIFLSEYIHYII